MGGITMKHDATTLRTKKALAESLKNLMQSKEIVRKQRKNGVENTARVLSTTDKPAATAIICLFGL